MPPHMVPDLVCEHHFNLIMRKIFDQRVPQEHPAGMRKTGQRGVGFHRFSGQGDLIKPLDRKMKLLAPGGQFLTERSGR